MSAGIDYGMGQTNVDKENGIRYGVISIHDVLQAWYDSAESVYSQGCPHCGNELTKHQKKAQNESMRCAHCHKTFSRDESFAEDASEYILDDGEYKASQGGDDTDIFILKSPYYTFAPFCSPCAPGAGYLSSDSQHDESNGVKTYCFGHDFFDDNKAPYRVYSVADDKEVTPAE